MDSTNDRQRKDRLIQTRVPQNLESTLKDEARKRRLSVSHLIRNVLEDTFNLVDNVVNEVDRVVSDSVGMAQTLRRDAQRLAATARGQTAHREPASYVETDDHDAASHPPSARGPEGALPPARAPEGALGPPAAGADIPTEPSLGEGSLAPEDGAEEAHSGSARSDLSAGPLASVYGFQELVLNRAAQCAACGVPVPRGTRAFLGMTDQPGPRLWVCQDCVDAL